MSTMPLSRSRHTMYSCMMPCFRKYKLLNKHKKGNHRQELACICFTMCSVLVDNAALEPVRGQLGNTLLRGLNVSLPSVQVRQADVSIQLQNLPNELVALVLCDTARGQQVVLGVKVNGIGHICNTTGPRIENQTILLKLDAVCLLTGSRKICTKKLLDRATGGQNRIRNNFRRQPTSFRHLPWCCHRV